MDKYGISGLKTFSRINKDLKEHVEKAQQIVLPPISRNMRFSKKWLIKAANNEVFIISQDKFRHYEPVLMKTVTKQELNNYIIQESGKPTGFAENALPDKNYLIDCLYSIKPDHELFRTIDETLALLIPEK